MADFLADSETHGPAEFAVLAGAIVGEVGGAVGYHGFAHGVGGGGAGDMYTVGGVTYGAGAAHTVGGGGACRGGVLV